MAKKKKKPWYKNKYTYIGMLLVSSFFVAMTCRNFIVFFNLQSQISANELLLAEKENEQEELETKRRNLTNPDYLEFLARGKYHVSRQGEQVFVFPSLSSDGQ